MDRYSEIHRLALGRLTPADRGLWQEWAALRDQYGFSGLTDAHRAAERRWVDAFEAVAQEISGSFRICAYDQWL